MGSSQPASFGHTTSLYFEKGCEHILQTPAEVIQQSVAFTSAADSNIIVRNVTDAAHHRLVMAEAKSRPIIVL